MKYFILLFPICILFFACGGDDEMPDNENRCEEADFVSRWRGDVVCDSSNVNFQGFEFSLDSNSELVFMYENFQINNAFTVVRTNCMFTAETTWEDNSGDIREVTVTGELKGDKFETTITRIIDGVVDEKCTGSVFERY